MAYALHIPALAQHLDTDDTTNVLSGFPCIPNGADHFAQDRFVTLVSVENARVDLDREPLFPVFVIWIAKQFIFLRQVFKERCCSSGVVRNTKQNWTRSGPHRLKRRGPVKVVFAPRGVDS